MFPLIIFITIPVLAVAFLCGRFTAKYATERGALRARLVPLGRPVVSVLSCSVDGLGAAAKKVRPARLAASLSPSSLQAGSLD